MKVLYYDCFSGISGDMNLGAMIDLGVDPAYLRAELGKLNLGGYEVRAGKDMRRGISGTKVDVVLKDDEKGHGNAPGASGNSGHSAGSGRPSRNLADIMEIVSSSALDEAVRKRSEKMFTMLAEAEARVHGKKVEEIHFHEVGAVDSIVDIVGAAICIEYLKPDRICCSVVELGTGYVDSEHGRLPVPAPATAELLKGVPVSSGSADMEATTPTGAVILAANVDEFTPMKSFRIEKTAYGIGQREGGAVPNVLRVFLGEAGESVIPDTGSDPHDALVIECNIDDMNPEFYGYVIDELFSAGADDAFLTPLTMKKLRPATKLSVLCSPDLEEKITGILLTRTTSLGVRKYRVEKSMLERDHATIETKFGKVRIKYALSGGERIKSKPEYEDCAKIAREQKIPIQDVYREIDKHLANQ